MNRKEIFEMMNNLSNVDLDAFPSLAPFEDADVIHSYTRAEAIADGVLIDVSKQAAEVGITVHTAITPGIWTELVGSPKWVNWGTEEQRLKRLLSNAISESERATDGVALFVIRMSEEGFVVGEIPVRAVLGNGDNLETVLTVMLGHED